MKRILTFTAVILLILTSCDNRKAENNSASDKQSPVISDHPKYEEFEVAASLYPWELHDEGIENILDNLQSMACVNSIYLVGLMHPEPRPHGDTRFIHNPKRLKWFPEDSRIYWVPDHEVYKKIKPLQSDESWLNETDWLSELIKEGRKRKLKVGVEISHSIIDTRILLENPEMIQRDIYGKPAEMHWNNYWPCPNHPDFQEYTTSLFTDLAKNYDLDFIQTCMLLFVWGDSHTAGCFCDNCIQLAEKEGHDMKKIMQALKQDPNAQPFKNEWIGFRKKSAIQIYKRIYQAIRDVNPTIEFRLNHHTENGGVWADGLLHEIVPYIQSVRVSDYAEQSGNTSRFENKSKWIKNVGMETEGMIPIIAGVGIRSRANPDIIQQGIIQWVKHGISGISLGHYDGAYFSNLRAVRQGLFEAGIKGVVSHHVIEAEKMSYRKDGHQRISWSPEMSLYTSSSFTAEQKLDTLEGFYSLRITYLDEDGGEASLAVMKNNQIIDQWLFDQETKCWMTRIIPRIKISNGDIITLTGNRDENDWAYVDAIEFIKDY